MEHMLNLRKKKKSSPESDLFFSMFAGEFVQVTLKLSITEMVSTPEGSVSQQLPLTVTGYLLDMDDNYYYIGDRPDEVHAAAKIKDVALIQEVRLPDAMDKLLEGADMGKVN